MSSALTAPAARTLGQHLPRPRPSTRPSHSPRARRGRAARSSGSAGPPAPPGRRRAAPTAPRPRARARSRSCTRTRWCHARASRVASSCACPSTCSSPACASDRAEERIPPPARAMLSYDSPATLSSYSRSRQPANGRWVWQSTKPGNQRAAARVDLHLGVTGAVEPGDRLAVDQQRPGFGAQLTGAVVAQIGEPVLGRPQHLRRAVDRDGAVDGDRAHPCSGSSIGIRRPDSCANATACS